MMRDEQAGRDVRTQASEPECTGDGAKSDIAYEPGVSHFGQKNRKRPDGEGIAEDECAKKSGGTRHDADGFDGLPYRV
jgi:hypothetical protein